jgi:hypothetical protein
MPKAYLPIGLMIWYQPKRWMAKCIEEGLLASILKQETKRIVEKTGVFMLDAFKFFYHGMSDLSFMQ